MGSVFGAMIRDSFSSSSNGLVLLRGVVDSTKGWLQEIDLTQGLPDSPESNTACCNYEVLIENSGRTLCASAGQLRLNLHQRYAPLRRENLLGLYDHSAGGIVDISEDAHERFVISNPKLKGVEAASASSVCRDGA